MTENERLKAATHVSIFLFKQWSAALERCSIALRELEEMERVIVFEADELDRISRKFNNQLDVVNQTHQDLAGFRIVFGIRKPKTRPVSHETS